MMVIERKNAVIEITSFGKSMYGGWYVNFMYITGDLEHNKDWRNRYEELRAVSNCYDGIRRDTLREVCNWLGVSRTALTRDVQRIDN